ncbi:MAG: hypothetical protein ACRBCK_05050 [Alphaproteobacteria bacterium]
MSRNYIAEGYERIKLVDNIYALLTSDFEPKANVVLYPRALSGDFDALAVKMAEYFDLGDQEIFIKYSENSKLKEFRDALVEDDLRNAVDVILNDMEFLYASRARVHMRLLTKYTQHSDTYKFHVDGVDQNFDRFMTCYNNPVTEFVKNDDVLRVFGHDAWCKEGAKTYNFAPGDIWKARIRNKPKGLIDTLIDKITREKERRSFVHRAQASDNPRLVVVADLRLH